MNLPNEFKNEMMSLLGNDYEAFICEYERPYYSALRINTRKVADTVVEDALKSDGLASIERVSWEPNGIYYDENIVRPGKSPLHEAGLYYIQEPSAMISVPNLDVDSSGLKVLDLCSAPGGKTTQIADYMAGKGLLVANEIVMSRAKILSENIERMGVANAIVISADPRDIENKFEGYFDRVLVDAPCSGEGMFRKHPEAVDEWSLDNVKQCTERQSWVLDCAAKMLKDGGRLVYSTCTFNGDEDEGSANEFLKRHPEFELIPCDDDGDSNGQYHRIFPHIHKGEGHFAAVFRKKGTPIRRPALCEKPARKEQYKPFLTFIDECLTENGRKKVSDENGIYLMFGDNLYLAPADTPSLKGLKVLRPGLHLGTIIKDRFEPSHALALYLKDEDVVRTCDFSADGDIKRYLIGESLRCEPDRIKVKEGAKENGWLLMTVCGYSLGWSKNVNGMLKNHYPKGLRK